MGEKALWRRRDLLSLGLGAAAMGLGARTARAAPPVAAPRRLSFYCLHTGESLDRTYWADGGYLPEALDEIDRVLRDFRTGEVRRIERPLLDLLVRLRARLDTSEPFHVISGYRSPQTNAMLAAASEGVASHSLHIQGMAIDIRLPNRSLASLHAAALELKGGGVGYYRASDFVHVDIGRPRSWG